MNHPTAETLILPIRTAGAATLVVPPPPPLLPPPQSLQPATNARR